MHAEPPNSPSAVPTTPGNPISSVVNSDKTSAIGLAGTVFTPDLMLDRDPYGFGYGDD